MTAQDFLDWMDKMNVTKAVEIVGLLGIGRNPAQGYLNDAKAGRDVELKRAVALAMSACAQNLQPWGTTKGN